MKKIYLNTMAVLLAGSAMAQLAQPRHEFALGTIDHVVPAPSNPLTRAVGAVVWSNNFDAPSDWVLDNDGQAGGAFGWSIDATLHGWYSSMKINSTSGGNFAELSNGNPSSGTQVSNVTYTMTTANPIDIMTLAGTDQVMLSFQQSGARFNDLQEIQISLDGITFFTVGNNLDKTVLSSTGGSAYANPETKIISLGEHLNGNASSVWIRFSWTTNYPSQSSNPNVWITYGWFIDDVKIQVNPDNNLAVKSSYWGSVGLKYYTIPTSQVAPIDFSANVKNEALNTASNSRLEVTMNGSVLNNNPVSIAAGSGDSLTVDAFTPPADGSYTFTWQAVSDSVDDIPGNNTITGNTFTVGGYIYKRDKGTYQSAGGGNDDNGDEGFEAGNLFDIFATEDVYAVDVTIGTGTPANTTIYAKIYELDANGDFVFLIDSPEHDVTATEVSQKKTISMLLNATLEAGKTYLAVVGCYSEFFFGTSGSTEPQTSFIMYPNVGGSGSQYYTTSTPMVRLNFDPTVGMEEIVTNEASLSQNIPNPANGLTAINFSLNSSAEVSFELIDLTGKMIQSADLGTLSAGKHLYNLNVAELAKGVYAYSIVVNGQRMSKRMVVE